MYTTYAISDPTTGMFVYVGQSVNFERRKRDHLASHREKKTPAKSSIKTWLRQMHKAKITPHFTVLEVVETETESLASETKWVEKLAAAGHALYNRWKEHRAEIETHSACAEEYIAKIFPKTGEGEPMTIGRMKSNRKKTGYRIEVEEGYNLKSPFVIDCLLSKPSEK